MWQPAYRWKRYRDVTKRGIVVFWVVWAGSLGFLMWFWLPKVQGAFSWSFAGLVLTAWAMQFAALESLRLIGLREPRNGT